MIGIRIAALLCTLGVLLVAPASARAQSWWKLNKLSGPEFQGIGAEVRIKCWAGPNATQVENEKRSGPIFSLCPKQPRRRHSVNVDAAWMFSKRDERFADGHQIYMTTLGGSVSTRPNEVIELGTGAHVAFFTSRGMDETVHKFLLEPIRLDLRPLQDAWKWDDTKRSAWWREGIVVRVGLLWFPTGFAAGELGPIEDGDTAVHYFGLYLDFGF